MRQEVGVNTLYTLASTTSLYTSILVIHANKTVDKLGNRRPCFGPEVLVLLVSRVKQAVVLDSLFASRQSVYAHT